MRVALTFDAEHPDRSKCPPGTQERMLDVLEEAGLRVTFFLQGRWVSAYPATARRIAESGHLVGNHSDYHARLPLFTDEGVRADVRGAERTILDVVGVDPRPWFRCPFGEGHDDARIQAVLGELGYRNVHWDADGEDWGDDRGSGDVEEAIVEGATGTGDGAIVLLHTWPGPTLEALPRILARLRDAGASFVTVAEVVDGG